jgi:hypothetical protein
VSLERVPFSLVSTNEELLGRLSSGFGLESREYGHKDPSRWPRGTLYPQKFALTSPTSGCRSVGIDRSRTQAMEFSFYVHRFQMDFNCSLNVQLKHRCIPKVGSEVDSICFHRYLVYVYKCMPENKITIKHLSSHVPRVIMQNICLVSLQMNSEGNIYLSKLHIAVKYLLIVRK